LNEIPLEKIVQLVVSAVVDELTKRGVKVSESAISGSISQNIVQSGQLTGFKTKSEKIDLSNFRSPVLTENHIKRLHQLTAEIIIPRKTVITPKAREAIKRQNISIRFEN